MANEAEFFARRPNLQLLEQRLPSGSTLVVPVASEGPAHLASDPVVEETLRALLADFLAPPATFAAKCSGVVEELCQVRPGHAAEWVGAACDIYLAYGLDGADEQVVRAVTSGATADPGSTPKIVRAALASINFATEARSHWGPPLPLAAAAAIMNRAVAGGIAAVRTRADAPALTFGILGEALRLSRAVQSPAMLVESIAATVIGGKGLERVTPGDIARFSFSEAASSRDYAGLVCAAVLRSAGPDATSAVRDQAAMTLSVPFASFVTLTSNAFISISEVPESPGEAIARSITVRNADFIPAFMIGATVSKPDAAVDILIAGLNRDSVVHGRSTVGDILFASLLSAPARSVELAAAAVGRGDLAEGNAPALIADAIARGVPASRVDETLAAQTRAQPIEPDYVKATVAGALSGSTIASRMLGQAEMTRAIALASGRSADVLDQAIPSAPRQGQHVAVLGVLAADPANAPALLERALANPALDTSQAPLLSAAGGLVIQIQRNPAGFFPATLRRLADPGNSAPEAVSAILLGAALANPRGVHAVAASIAVNPDGFSSEALRSVAALGNPGIAAALEPAVTAALAVAGDEAATGRFIRREVKLRPSAVAELTAGATAARPALATLIGESAAQAAPNSAPVIVRSLFAFSGKIHPHAPTSDSAEAHAAGLISSVIRGVVSAHLDPASEHTAVSEAVATAVRCVFALARDPAAPGKLPAPSVLAAVIESATRAAPAHALAIARSAALATRALAGRDTAPLVIRDAVLAGRGDADPGQVAAAIAAGIEEWDRYVPAATARKLSDYSYDNLTGPALTRYLDL